MFFLLLTTIKKSNLFFQDSDDIRRIPIVMKKLVAFISILMLATACFARQISVQVVQHNDAWNSVGEHSLIVEDELMNGFFDYGYIVTNSETTVSASEEDDEELLNSGFVEAYDGFSDVFVQVKLYFKKIGENASESGMDPSKLDHAELVIMDVKTGKKIQVTEVKGSTKLPGTDENVKTVSKSIITAIRKAL